MQHRLTYDFRSREFARRVTNFRGDRSPYANNEPSNHDPDNHGTAVAGIAAGQNHGVAPWANIVNVKVHGTGGMSQLALTNALSDIIDQHVSMRSNPRQNALGYPWRGSVINLSAGAVHSVSHTSAYRMVLERAAAEGIRKCKGSLYLCCTHDIGRRLTGTP